MTLKVIGAGFGRTGTLSLKLALETLGYSKCHHMLEVAKSGAQVDFWDRIATGKPPPRWDEVFEGFEACTDFPACIYYEALAAHYPDAKIILTVREDAAWQRSVVDTIYTLWQSMPPWLSWLVPRVRKLQRAIDLLVWQGALKNQITHPTHARALFNAHNRRVQASFPPDRLLVFDVKAGWAPLCNFLDKPIPDTPFPRTNETRVMKRRILSLKILSVFPFALAAAMTIVVLV